MVVLVERGNEPYRGSWALPGGFVEVDEDLPEAAVRELAEETGIELSSSQLSQLGAYGKPGRDPRMRVVSIVYYAFVDDLADPVGGSDAASSRLVMSEVLLVCCSSACNSCRACRPVSMTALTDPPYLPLSL